MLISKAHNIFMENDSPTEFILTHFPDRFYYLCKAASKQVPIDEVLDEHLDDVTSERYLQMGSQPVSILENSADRPQSPMASSIPSPGRLFPTPPEVSTLQLTWRPGVNSCTLLHNRPCRRRPSIA
jgi:hypothetical protein